MSKQVRKAVIPAAGLGTRFLPVTKTLPKELLPVLNKPLVQYAVEEAVASGMDTIILITSEAKHSVEDYFRPNPALAGWLERRGRKDVLETLNRICNMAKIRSVVQQEPLGLGHAVGCARHLLCNEPFAVLLPDLIIDSQTPCLRQLVDAYASHQGCMVAAQEVDADAVDKCGILAVDPVPVTGTNGRLLRVIDLAEKPSPERAPSRLGIVGRYALDPEIFECIDCTSPDSRGEIQITDSIRFYSRTKPVHALRFEGTLYDVGNPLGFLRATVELALKDPEYGKAFRAYLSSLRFTP